jgi:hypothetical protein
MSGSRTDIRESDRTDLRQTDRTYFLGSRSRTKSVAAQPTLDSRVSCGATDARLTRQLRRRFQVVVTALLRVVWLSMRSTGVS